MIILSFEEKGQKYRVQVEKGENLLPRLDKFLKKHKIDKTGIKNWQISFYKEKSIISKRIAQSIFHALKAGT
ncbi:MAG: hypothetical protein PHF45_00130 [Candidatus Pacebacteria bacterium]|nr:hypothetical protein [Candidatus Paceibacterota bacterium]